MSLRGLKNKEDIMRKSGILLHISSLPGKYGIGGFGKEAYRFVDKLKVLQDMVIHHISHFLLLPVIRIL